MKILVTGGTVFASRFISEYFIKKGHEVYVLNRGTKPQPDGAEKGLPFYVPGNGDMPLQFFHIEDLCRFIEIIAEKRPEPKIFNVGNSSTVTVNEWVRLCYKAVGKTPEIMSVSGHNPRDYFCFRDYGYVLDTSRQHELMPNEKPLETGLSEAYEWYADNRDKIRKKDYLEYIDANLKEYRK